MSTRMASKRFSSEKSSVLTKEALADLNLHEFDILPNWEPTSGKIYTKVRAISARINQNFDGWPSEELKKSYRTFLGKPVFVNHVNDDPRKARGVVVAARFVENGDDKYIEVIQEVDADKFPKLAHELISGGLDSVSMGAEARICKCSYCGNEASDMLSMCSHVLSKKGQVLGRVNDDGTQEDVLVYEECRDISFFELSYVFDPADETAVVSNVLTANRKRGYGETSLPPQVDTLRDEEEDLAGYFIEPPREFQEPDLDEDYPVVEEGQPFGHRRDEEQREDFNMSRVSRNRRRQTRTRQAAPHPSGIDFDALLGEGWENEHRFPQKRQPSFDNWDGENYEGPRGTGRVQWEGDNDLSWENSQGESGRTKGNIWDAMHDVEDSLGHYSSNRRSKGNRMSHNRRARRRYAEEFGRNDQGEQEEVFISQTPPAEPVETGEGAADAPNNTKSDRVKTDQNRSNHTNLEARRRRARRRGPRKTADSHELYKDFLEYAQGQGMDLDRMQELYDRNYESNGMDEEADLAVRDFEEMMYDFLGVNSVDEDDRLYTLMEAPGSYEINHPYNFRGASRKRRSNRRRPRKTADYNGWTNWETWNTIVWYGNDPGAYDIAKSARSPEELAENAPYVVGDDVDFDQVNWDEVYEAFEEDRTASRRRSRRRRVARGDDYDWLNSAAPGTTIQSWDPRDETYIDLIKTDRGHWHSPDYMTDLSADEVAGNEVEFKRSSSKRRSNRRHPSPLARRRMAEQSDDFNLNSRSDIARNVEDEEVFISETGPQTQPKDASRKARRKRADDHLDAPGVDMSQTMLDGMSDYGDAVAVAFDSNGNAVDLALNWETAQSMANEGYNMQAIRGDGGMSQDDIQRMVDYEKELVRDLYGSRRRRPNRRRARSRRMAVNGWANWDTWHANMYLGEHDDIARDIAFADSGQQVADMFGELLEGTDVDPNNVDWDELHDVYSSDRDYYRNASRKRRSSRRRVALLPDEFGIDGDSAMAYDAEAGMFVDVQPGDNGYEWYLYWDSGSDYTNVTQNLAESGSAGSLDEAIEQAAHEVSQYSPDSNPFRQSARKRRAKMSKNPKRRRRMADTNLDLAAPGGRVNVEAPVKNTTDEEAQASQFDKRDFGNNAGDGIADPDLSTDQNWAPGEGQKTSTRASEIEGMRLAEAMVEAGLENQEDRWKLAEAYTKLPANIVRDRIALLARTASAKSAVRDDKSQRPVKSAQKAPGLGQRPTLQKSANKSDDYTLYL